MWSGREIVVVPSSPDEFFREEYAVPGEVPQGQIRECDGRSDFLQGHMGKSKLINDKQSSNKHFNTYFFQVTMICATTSAYYL
jgi:hypothetical protein